ncbi:hypothetical protein [Hamadaea tsunoensis]|uniref:hypothetical protein n=1 Tax=Hamadaea tsunoensis TaxID=53368 RepID=UPI0007E8D256|nr:hypothetical protein [Hamadaea tsunoensis]
MSDYFDLFLTMELRPDVPEDVLHEIRWHTYLADTPPAGFQSFEPQDWYLDNPYPLFSGIDENYYFDGADVAALVRTRQRLYEDHSVRWQFTVRSCVHEDELANVCAFAAWLAGYATTRGWIGYLRSSADDETRILTYDGAAIHGLAIPARPSVPEEAR